jgi:hypothetical protein
MVTWGYGMVSFTILEFVCDLLFCGQAEINMNIPENSTKFI